MEILWRSYGSPMDQHASTWLATGLQVASDRVWGGSEVALLLRHLRQGIIENANIPGEIYCLSTKIPAEAGFSILDARSASILGCGALDLGRPQKRSPDLGAVPSLPRQPINAGEILVHHENLLLHEFGSPVPDALVDYQVVLLV